MVHINAIVQHICTDRVSSEHFYINRIISEYHFMRKILLGIRVLGYI